MAFQFSSVAQLCPTIATPWTAAHQVSLSITNSQRLLKLMSMAFKVSQNSLKTTIMQSKQCKKTCKKAIKGFKN